MQHTASLSSTALTGPEKDLMERDAGRIPWPAPVNSHLLAPNRNLMLSTQLSTFLSGHWMKSLGCSSSLDTHTDGHFAWHNYPLIWITPIKKPCSFSCHKLRLFTFLPHGIQCSIPLPLCSSSNACLSMLLQHYITTPVPKPEQNPAQEPSPAQPRPELSLEKGTNSEFTSSHWNCSAGMERGDNDVQTAEPKRAQHLWKPAHIISVFLSVRVGISPKVARC